MDLSRESNLQQLLESLESDISGIFNSNETSVPNENIIIEKIIVLWLRYNIPMKGFNELLKILKNIQPDNNEEFRASLNTNFNKCLQGALNTNNVVFYLRCEKCGGFQSKQLLNENYYVY